MRNKQKLLGGAFSKKPLNKAHSAGGFLFSLCFSCSIRNVNLTATAPAASGEHDGGRAEI